MSVPETLNKIRAWAESNQQMKAVVVIGSQARKLNQADRWSDIDIILFTTHPEKYQHEDAWLSEIGNLLSCYSGLEVADGTFVKRVYFDNGVGMDVTPVQVRAIDWAYRYARVKSKLPAKLLPASFTAKMEKPIRNFAYYIHRGMNVLVDKGGYREKLGFIESVFRYAPPGQPAQEKLEEQVHQFWQTALRMAIKLYRREFFTAKFECEAPMKVNLLTLMEWHAKCAHGWQFETWHKGRYIERWADPKIVEGLRAVYGRYEESDSWDSLFRTMELFERVSHEVAEQLGYNYDRRAEQRFREWIEELHTESQAASK
ncbi:MAG TPA: aminoglycoside 6-adenylyltransferase [Pyrinomonadaceae bacterium]|nr:aminoglycoside 6-adenylyltransferase [Pyrinomonadaceae bacterium]